MLLVNSNLPILRCDGSVAQLAFCSMLRVAWTLRGGGTRTHGLARTNTIICIRLFHDVVECYELLLCLGVMNLRDLRTAETLGLH